MPIGPSFCDQTQQKDGPGRMLPSRPWGPSPEQTRSQALGGGHWDFSALWWMLPALICSASRPPMPLTLRRSTPRLACQGELVPALIPANDSAAHLKRNLSGQFTGRYFSRLNTWGMLCRRPTAWRPGPSHPGLWACRGSHTVLLPNLICPDWLPGFPRRGCSSSSSPIWGNKRETMTLFLNIVSRLHNFKVASVHTS